MMLLLTRAAVKRTHRVLTKSEKKQRYTLSKKHVCLRICIILSMFGLTYTIFTILPELVCNGSGLIVTRDIIKTKNMHCVFTFFLFKVFFYSSQKIITKINKYDIALNT